jgi:hypothetical protein
MKTTGSPIKAEVHALLIELRHLTISMSQLSQLEPFHWLDKGFSVSEQW